MGIAGDITLILVVAFLGGFVVLRLGLSLILGYVPAGMMVLNYKRRDPPKAPRSPRHCRLTPTVTLNLSILYTCWRFSDSRVPNTSGLIPA